MPPRKKIVEMDLGDGVTILVDAVDGDAPEEESSQPTSPWPDSGESDDSPLDGPDQKFVAEARERVRNGTADFGDARRLLQILDKVTGA